jgi:CelD/BcsL family acetyltransferase involved in cellulose biosynthesis
MLPPGVEIYTSFDALPERLVAFLAAAAERSFFQSLPWFRTILRTAGPSGDEPRIYVAENSGRPVAVLFARERKAAGRLKTHMLLGPSFGMYASFYAPVLDAELGIAGLREIAAAIARMAPRLHVLRFDSLNQPSPEFAALAAAFRARGMLVQSFRNYDNYYADVRSLTVEGYLAQRSRQTRYFIGRHVRRLARSGRGRFELIKEGPDLRSAFVDYALVDLQSWKDQEPYADCITDILPLAASAGVLRLGLLYVDDAPAAAQIWIVSGGCATLLRLHHAKKFAKLSVGVVLTFEMIRHMLTAEKLSEIDFGPGDDAFKRKWFSQHRERAGLLVFNPRTLKGLIAAARHIGGHAAKAAARRLRNAARHLLGRA